MLAKPIILGQAPSAKGDGRPFTGPSGKTLCRWLGVGDREELERYFVLENLIAHPLDKNHDPKRRNSELTPAEARLGAMNFLTRTRTRLMKEMGSEGWGQFSLSGVIQVVVLGNKVWKGFGLPRASGWFDEQFVGDEFLMVKFPHPSGLNHELNDPEFVCQVSTRLRYIAQGLRHSKDPA